MATKTVTVVYVVITQDDGTFEASVFHTFTSAKKHALRVGGTLLERTVRTR